MFNRWFLTADIPLSLCIPFHYGVLLVVLSYLVAVFAAYTSFHLIDRVRAEGAVTVRRVWLATAGVSMGLGIWAMHFIAMLAMQIPIPITYDIVITGLSAGCAMLASAAGFIILMGDGYERWRLCLAGLVLGGGVGIMHYSGMAALIMPAHIYYDPSLFALSIVVAVTLSTAALWALRDLPRLTKRAPILSRLIASAVMGFAIALMHYTGMFATFFYPEAMAPTEGLFFNTALMAAVIGTATLLILVLALISARYQRNRTQAQNFRRVLINNLPAYFAVIDEAGRITSWNDNLSRLIGLSDADLQGMDATAVAVESDRDAVRTKIREAFVQGSAALEFGVLSKSGEVHAVRWSAQTIVDDDHQHLIATGVDMTQMNAAAAKIRESEERFRTVFEAVNDGILVIDADTLAFLDMNPRACQMFGYTREELFKLDAGVLAAGVSPYTREEIRPMIQRALAGEALVFEWQSKAKDGHLFWIEISIRRARYGSQNVLLATQRDITKRKQADDKIAYLARYDGLTGLFNRGVFVEALKLAIARSRRGAKGLAVLYLDLDHFKDVNDTLGHPVGDLLLRAVAERLRANVRVIDVVARFGGDEFAIILTDIQEPADAALVADRLLDAISEPIAIQETAAAAAADKLLTAFSTTFSIEGNEIRSGTTIGISVYGTDSPDAETMLAHADVALYRAKLEGRGTYRFFTDAMDAEIRARVTMEKELREAIASNQLFLAYQPQVAIDSGRIVGIEALVRWHHPTRGILGPGRFIPAAEKNGLIVPLGHWIMREACRQFKLWLDAGIAPPLIAINLSSVQFKNTADLEKDIASVLAEYELQARFLELELTESVLMDASHEHNELLLRLRKAGHRISIDDFGSGYSSLDYLRRFPVDRMKIAQSFVADIGIVPGDDAIVRAALGLARELDIEVVLEGVENALQLKLLKSWGARIVQGFYFSKPLPALEMTPVLRGRKIVPTDVSAAGLVA